MKNHGKRICETLKAVRQQVATANGIDYAPAECHHKGDCAGTCPKCEAEVQYLERQLRLRRQLGKAVAVVGVSMGLTALASCDSRLVDLDSGPGTSLTISKAAESHFMGDVVEAQPYFPGGQQALLAFLRENAKYPKDMECCAQGRVVVSFIVDVDGSIIEPKVVRGICNELDKEALRVVSLMPKWIPGKQNGKNVKVKYNLPVPFRLE